MPSPQLASVVRLIIIGVLITWPLAAAVAALLLGMSPGAAVMIGVILVVSGPMVAGLLLGFVRSAGRLQRVQVRRVTDRPGRRHPGALTSCTHGHLGSKLAQFAVSVVIGLACGAAGMALLWLLLRTLRLGMASPIRR
jgi:NhaP-type Na+/H+ or K+/H+ antiporter